MADGTNTTVKTTFEASTESAIKSIGRLISKVSEYKSALGGATKSTAMENSAASMMKNTSAIEAQIKKIGELKAQISQIKSLYSQLNSTITKQATAATNRDSYAFPGTPEWRKYNEQVTKYEAQIDSLRARLAELAGVNESTFKGSDIEARIYSLTTALKSEEAELKSLQNAQRQASSGAKEEASAQSSSASSAKRSASAHRNLKTTLTSIGKTLKNIKSRISSVVGGFKNLASSIKGAIPHSKNFGGAIGKLASTFKRLFVMRLLRNLIANIIKAFKEGTQNVAQYSAALNGLDSNNANKAMSELASTGAYLKNVLGSAVIPVLNALLPIIRSIATGFATAVNYVNQFMSALGGKTSWTRAKSVTVDYASTLSDAGSAAKGAKDSVEDLKRTILGFDEINKLNDATGSSGSGSGGSGSGGSDSVNYADMFEEVPIDNKVMKWLKELKPYIDDIKKAWKDVKNAVSELVNSAGFKYLVGEVFKGILTGIKSLLENIASVIRTFKSILNSSGIKDRIGEISDAWGDVLKAVNNLVNSPAFKKFLEIATYVVLQTVKSILEGIAGFIDTIRKTLSNLDENGKLDEFKDAWDRVTGAITDLINSEGFQYLISAAFTTVLDVITGALNLIASLAESFKKALNDLKNDGTLDGFESAFSDIKDAVKKISESKIVQSLLSSSLKHALKQVSGVLQVIADVLGLISGILDGDIIGSIERVVLAVIDIAGIVMRAMIQPLEDIGNAIVNWINKITGLNLPTSNFMSEWEQAHNKTRQEVEEFFDGLGSSSKKEGKKAGKNYAEGFEDGADISLDIDTDKYGEFKDEVANTVMNAPITARTTKAKEAARQLREEINKTKATVPVDANTSSAETKTNTYKAGVQKTTTNPVTADTSSAEKKANTFKDGVKKTTTNPITADTTSAFAKANKFRDDIKKKTTIAPVSAKLENGDTLKTNLETTLDDVIIKGKDGKVQNMKDIWNNFNTYMEDTKIKGKDGKIQNMQAMWNAFNTFMSDTHIKAKDNNIYNRYEIWKNFSEYMDGVEFNAIAWVDPVLTGSISDFNTGGNGGRYSVFTGGIIGKNFDSGGIVSKAVGGLVAAGSHFIDSAQIFMARENGIPEYVGRFGSHSAVANNYQIIEGISSGVASAMVSQNELLREQNSLLREIANNNGAVSVSSVLGAVNRVNKRTGQPVVTMG